MCCVCVCGGDKRVGEQSGREWMEERPAAALHISGKERWRVAMLSKEPFVKERRGEVMRKK